jgi:peptidoglycan hydrolase-like protein with peptidoglycan-binding domain
MRLSQGDSGDAVKVLQRGLNKLASLLIVDGKFGPGTADAISVACPTLGLAPRTDADDELSDALARAPELSAELGTAGATFIARAEIASAKDYRNRYCHPTWPSAKSGITIGIGYDLQFASADSLRADWGTRIADDVCARLIAACGSVGSDALVGTLRDIDVPLFAAMTVFTSNTLPQTIKQTASIYPQVMELSLPRRAALVSLVYNRGASLTDHGDPALENRREMRAIQDLLAAGNVDAVADQFDSMARLWDPGLPGLVKRRHDEATMWRSGFAALSLE